ncbi:MAG: hypothetical protein JW728_05640 [Candidatus Aureabacteria bacterium]|nr:hypothetical protein [Candidatus Auribacterota bacterium]
MRFSIEVNQKEGLGFEVSCPELGISAHGGSFEEAVDKIKSLISFLLFNSPAGEINFEEIANILEDISESATERTFFLPKNDRLH